MKGKLGRKKKNPCLNLKMKMLMWFLFQKHILLIKSMESSRLVGGPAVVGLPALQGQARLATRSVAEAEGGADAPSANLC